VAKMRYVPRTHMNEVERKELTVVQHADDEESADKLTSSSALDL
jgi:hypothetical protein